MVDAVTAKTHKFAVGDKVQVLFRGPTEEFTVVGITGFGEADNLAGATLAIFDVNTAQRVFAKVGRFDSIEAKATEGPSDLTLRDRVAAVVPPGLEVVTSQQVADEAPTPSSRPSASSAPRCWSSPASRCSSAGSSSSTPSRSSWPSAPGSSPCCGPWAPAGARCCWSVVAEAFIVGLFASLVGLGLGVLVAIGLQSLLKAFGIDLPASGVVVPAPDDHRLADRRAWA